MFGFGIGEIILIAVIAVIFLGPDKLPSALVDIARFFKSAKGMLNDAKDTIDKEINIAELKKEALEYKQKFENTLEDTKQKASLDSEFKQLENVKSDIEDAFNYDAKKMFSNYSLGSRNEEMEAAAARIKKENSFSEYLAKNSLKQEQKEFTKEELEQKEAKKAKLKQEQLLRQKQYGQKISKRLNSKNKKG